MQLYRGKVRLAGSVANEVPKQGMTAAEILVLRELHGHDAVVDIAKQKMDNKRTSAKERERLTNTYASPTLGALKAEGRRNIIRNLFGHDSLDLPKALAEPVAEAPVVERPKASPVARAEETQELMA